MTTMERKNNCPDTCAALQEPCSPCIGYCSTSLGDLICRGCGRTAEEVDRWLQLDDQEKQSIWQRVNSLDTLRNRRERTVDIKRPEDTIHGGDGMQLSARSLHSTFQLEKEIETKKHATPLADPSEPAPGRATTYFTAKQP
jgi:predicted Fe-S protein YdhL (DUF1289 family)